MKQIIIVLIFKINIMSKFISTLLCCLIVGVMNAQTEEESKVKWDYPIKLGSAEWASFTTGQQMRDACQIPPKILETLSTKDLVEICLNYPLLSNYFYYNDERVGINRVINGFNGLLELSNRKDCIQELINVYKNYPVLTQIPNNSSKDYHTPFKQASLELLFSDDLFSKQLDEQLAIELSKIVLEKYAGAVENIEIYGLYSIKKSLLLGAVVMDSQNISLLSAEQRATLKRFIENYNNLEPELLSETSKIISGR